MPRGAGQSEHDQGQDAGMPTHVALLRGVNVGGHNRVAMAELRSVVASLGHTDVATYIQSGNVVFTAADPDAAPATLATGLEEVIAAELGVRARVVVLSGAELAAVAVANPYPDQQDPKRLHAIFLTGEPDADAVAFLTDAQAKAALKGSRDEARFVGRTLYLHTPDGFGRSELAKELSRPRGPAQGTARNWATVTRLLAMLDA
jgi:uncharacterized protein (DUF1697 family)